MNPFNINFRSLAAVKKMAQRLVNQSKKPMVVFKHPDRNNYNVTFKSRIDRYALSWVVSEINPQ